MVFTFPKDVDVLHDRVSIFAKQLQLRIVTREDKFSIVFDAMSQLFPSTN